MVEIILKIQVTTSSMYIKLVKFGRVIFEITRTDRLGLGLQKGKWRDLIEVTATFNFQNGWVEHIFLNSKYANTTKLGVQDVTMAYITGNRIAADDVRTRAISEEDLAVDKSCDH